MDKNGQMGKTSETPYLEARFAVHKTKKRKAKLTNAMSGMEMNPYSYTDRVRHDTPFELQGRGDSPVTVMMEW